MSKQDTLTAERERELFRQWKAGDESAGNTIVESFRPWAMTIAFNYSGGSRDEELRAAALEGLADSMRLFNLDRKVRFSSFARIVVNQTIQRQIGSRSRAQDHLSYCGAGLPESLTDKVTTDPETREQAECVSRLMELILKNEKLNRRAKEVLRIFIETPSSTLQTAGEKLGITREGVRQHLLKIRAAVAADPELLDAAREAGLRLGA